MLLMNVGREREILREGSVDKNNSERLLSVPRESRDIDGRREERLKLRNRRDGQEDTKNETGNRDTTHNDEIERRNDREVKR